jgi:two-component system NtrC family response regulator
MHQLLLVEDDPSLREILAYQLKQEGYAVTAAGNGRQALAEIRRAHWDLIITDVRMPQMDGLALLREVRRVDADLPVLLLTAYGTIQDAVEAIKAGAFDYLTKPVGREDLLRIVRKALQLGELQRENRRLRETLVERYPLEAMLGGSPAIHAAIRLIRQAAPAEATILLTGESGTGKELAARAIHVLSSRSGKPFVPVNCAAVPAGLMESELFGHRKGAFTGSTADHPGKFRQADGGTLLLDEVAELELRLQAKLLRVLQERIVDPVGSVRSVPVDVRLVCSTNQDLQSLVQAGRFREDLYHRLNVIVIHLPPLRERGEDVLLLLNHFYRRFGGGDFELDGAAERLLLQYDWPGNVREVMNLCQRLAVLHPRQPVTPEILPREIREWAGTDPATSDPGEETGLWELEKTAIRRALHSHRGNKSAAARSLRIPRHVLLYRMKKFGISD